MRFEFIGFLMAVSMYHAGEQVVVDIRQLCGTMAMAAHEAEAASAIASKVDRSDYPDYPDYLCTGLRLYNAALEMARSGRLAEAESLSERAVGMLEKKYAAEDPILFWPLHALAVVRFEQRKTSRAAEALRKMQHVRGQGPHQRAAVLEMGGALLEARGRSREAEQEYVGALKIWDETGPSNSAHAGGVLNCLAMLYLNQGRLEEAEHALDRALTIFRGEYRMPSRWTTSSC
jgi:tetratricopeptide (TPR) repeat protein